MDNKTIQRILGKKLNKYERTFINNILSSKEIQTKFTPELTYLETDGKEWTDQFYLASESSYDPRKLDGPLLNMVHGYLPTAVFTFSSGKVFLGVRHQNIKNEWKISPGIVFFVQKEDSFESFLFDIYNRPWLRWVQAINSFSCGYELIKIVVKHKYGLDIPLNISDDIDIKFLNKMSGILLIIQKEMVEDFNNITERHGIICHKIGSIQEGMTIILHQHNNVLVNLPVQLFNTIFGEDDVLNIRPSISESKSTSSNINNKKDFSEDVLIILREIKNKNQKREAPRFSVIKRKSKLVKDHHMNLAGMSINDNGHLDYADPELKGRSYIANASRKLVCQGMKPQLCSAIIQLKKGDDYSRLFLKGMRDMARILGVKIVNTSISEHEGDNESWVVVAGSRKNDTNPFSEGFQTTNDFISILGSHRGELGGGLYLRSQGAPGDGVMPIVDMNMEARIQETVFTGIQGGLIQSAMPVSGGGLTIAIAKTLVVSPSGFGARIYISRKLQNDELLFGETQGLVIVTIKENDLMEFERICMNIGVPTTSIGRVTDNGRYTFNEAVELEVMELKSI